VRSSPAILLAVFTLALAGCAAPIGRVTTNYDKFKDSNVEIVQVGNTVRLMRLAEGSKLPTYAFVIDGYSSGNRAAWPNELVFLLDGDQLRVRGDSSLEDVSVSRYSVSYHERSIFPVTGDQIRRIANSPTVEVKVYGRNRSFPGVTWDEPRIRAVEKFYRLFVQRDWDRLDADGQIEAAKPGTSD